MIGVLRQFQQFFNHIMTVFACDIESLPCPRFAFVEGVVYIRGRFPVLGCHVSQHLPWLGLGRINFVGSLLQRD